MAPPYSREMRRSASHSRVIQGYSTVLNEKGAQWNDEGLEEDGWKRGRLTYSEYELHGSGRLAGLR